jgi:uncharacterized Zn finger protein
MGYWRERYWGGYFPPSRPRQAKGGIKAQSQRDTFGQSWWAQRWIAVLEGFDIGARLGRGRSYARRGQVIAVEVGKGVIKAKVQGSRPKPYDVTIRVNVLSDADWNKAAKALAVQAVFAAKLLAGEMPQDIEEAFTKAGLSLFPRQRKDLKTECSCPDWSNPCKHIAAVYYLLGEEFDRDPFLIFKMRGLSREDLIRRLGARPAKKGEKTTQKSSAAQEARAPVAPKEPLPGDGARFWQGGLLANDFFGEVHLPPVAAALAKRLGHFPFWRGEQAFLEEMERIYAHAARRGLEVFLGEAGKETPALGRAEQTQARQKA